MSPGNSRHKFFTGIVPKLVTLFVFISFGSAALLVWVMSSSFQSGLLNYVSKRESFQIDQLVTGIEHFYAESQSWDGLRGNGRQWGRLLDFYLPRANRRGFQPENDSGNRRPGPDRQADRQARENNRPREAFENRTEGRRPPPRDARPNSLASRIRIIDETRSWIAGPIASHPGAQKYALESGGQPVGWITVDPALILTGEFELEFQKSQQRWLLIAALLLLFSSALLAWVVARHFLLPVKKLVAGADALSQGNYELQLDGRRSDELGELVDKFNHLSKALAASKQARDRWVADIAHELRTPLSILQGEIGALVDGTREINKNALESLDEEVKTLTRLVQDLYQLSLSDLGDLSYRHEPLNITDTVKGVVNSFRSTADAKSLTLELQSNIVSSLEINGDSDRLVQLLNNLLANSVRYTNANGRIVVTLSSNENQLILSVKDSAPGVSSEDLAHLFDRLYRAEKSRNRATGGAGLGLAISENIVKAHGGSIQATPSDLGGLAITVILPMSGDEV